MSSYKNEKLDKLYKKLPKIDCKRLCAASCGVIPVGKYEKQRIAKVVGREPFPEPEVILQKLENKEFDLTCSLLKEGKCEVYRIRPMVCRLYGLVKGMRCAFGCVPERWVSDREAKELLKKADYFEREK